MYVFFVVKQIRPSAVNYRQMHYDYFQRFMFNYATLPPINKIIPNVLNEARIERKGYFSS